MSIIKSKLLPSVTASGDATVKFPTAIFTVSENNYYFKDMTKFY